MIPDFQIPSTIDDHVIKSIFGRKDTLLNLTNHLLPEKLSLVPEKSSVLHKIQNTQGKVCDPSLRIGDENLSVWIEVQKSYYSYTENRVDIYSSGQLFSDISVGSNYSKLIKSVVIWISNDSVNKSEEKDYYRVVNESENIVKVYIELDRFRKHIANPENLSRLSERDHVIFALSCPDVHQCPHFGKEILTLYKNYCTAYIMAKRKLEINPNLKIFEQNEKKSEQSLLYKSAIRYLEATTSPNKQHFETSYVDLGTQTINDLFQAYAASDCPDVKPAKRMRLKNNKSDDETENSKKCDNQVVKGVEKNSVESNNGEEEGKNFENGITGNFLTLNQEVSSEKCDNQVVEGVERNSVESNNGEEEDKNFKNRTIANFSTLNEEVEFNSIKRAKQLIEIGFTDDQIKHCTYLNQSELTSLKELINEAVNTTKLKVKTNECFLLISPVKKNSKKVHPHENKTNIIAAANNSKKDKEYAKRLPLKTLNVNVKIN